MLLIGMTGPISHGKTTFASALMRLEPNSVHLESSTVIAAVANAMHKALPGMPKTEDVVFVQEWLKALPAILEEITHTTCTYEQIALDEANMKAHPIEYEKLFLHVHNIVRNPRLAQQDITNENKESYRPFLQWLGGYLVTHVDNGLWYKELIRQANQAAQNGCKLCLIGGLRYPTDAQLIHQAGGYVVKVYRPGHLQNDILDPTERERDNIQTDSTVVSNGSVEQLVNCAQMLLIDAKNSELKRVYETLDYSSPAGIQV